jgi:aminoglycoside phosphotransferase
VTSGPGTGAAAGFASGPPRAAVPVPARVRQLAGQRGVRAVWVNDAGGVTFEIGAGAGRCFVKWAAANTDGELAAEAARLRWAGRFSRVPRLLDEGSDKTGSWLVASPLAGQMACAGRWKAVPSTAVRIVGEALRAMHEALPVASCPFSWAAGDRLAAVRSRAAAGRLDPAAWHPSHRRLTVPAALGLLADIPAVDVQVVCHGDACVPNTMIADDGRWSGHVDLGALGVADRWADLAVATWSVSWNFGPKWESLLLAAYGVKPDEDRIRYYRLLYELS